MKKLIFLFLLIPVFVFGQIPDPLPNTYVNDLSGILDAAQIRELNDSILSIEKRSSVQIAVVLLHKLPDNISVEDYAMGIGRKWHVGNANNGLVYVAAIDEHKQRLEVADNLQGDIPDLYAHNITESIKPYFKQQDYFGGLKELLAGINSHVDPVLKEQLKLAEIERGKKHDKFMQNLSVFSSWFAGIGLLALGVWFFIFRPRYLKRKKEEEEAEQKLDEERANRRRDMLDSLSSKSDYVAPAIAAAAITKRRDDDPPKSNYSSGSGSSDSSSSSSSSSSSYGDWGSGSSGSSDSGFSGGGSSNDW